MNLREATEFTVTM